MPEGLAWQNAQGNILGLYLHVDCLKIPLRALFGAYSLTFDTVFEGLADFVEEHFQVGVLKSLIGLR